MCLRRSYCLYPLLGGATGSPKSVSEREGIQAAAVPSDSPMGPHAPHLLAMGCSMKLTQWVGPDASLPLAIVHFQDTSESSGPLSITAPRSPAVWIYCGPCSLGLSWHPWYPNQTRLLATCSVGPFYQCPVSIRLAFPVTHDAASQRICVVFPAFFRCLPAAVLLLPSWHPGD